MSTGGHTGTEEHPKSQCLILILTLDERGSILGHLISRMGDSRPFRGTYLCQLSTSLREGVREQTLQSSVL